MTGEGRSALRAPTGWALVAALLVLLGVGLRVYRFPSIPPGLNQDEAAAAYEAYCLLETGKDRWGNRLPPYFPAWGSGQSVLQSYLAVPFLAALGLSTLAARLPALLLGLLTVPLFFAAVRRGGGRDQALVATALLALAPWHVMLSRWALDANLLPFTLLLGTYAFARAVLSPSRLGQVLAFVPFALSFYSYGLAVLITPPLVLLLCVANRAPIAKHGRRFLLSAALALLLALPFGLVLLENQVFKADLGIERLLPFDVPLLPASRIEQGQAPAISTSVDFLLSGLRDDLIWNTLPDVAPLPAPVIVLALFGLVLAADELLRKRTLDPFAAWLLSGLPLLVLIPVNGTRANALFLPLLALAARAIVAIDGALPERMLRAMARGVGLAVLLLQSGHFAHHYFNAFPRLAAQAFNRNLDQAIAAAVARAGPGEQTLITEAVPLNYVYYLFYARVPPVEFQRGAVYETVPGVGYDVRRLGRVCFRRQALTAAPGETAVLVQRAGEEALCPEPEVLFRDKWWRVSRCARTDAGPAASVP